MIAMKKVNLLSIVLLSITLLFCACSTPQKPNYNPSSQETVSLSNIPDYSGEPSVVLNDNQPEFTSDDLNTDSYEYYSKPDELGRCGVAEACIGQEVMPTEDRKNISHIIPSGWQSKEYKHIDGNYLYNRCHLIGFQLTGENANERNLITGTRYMNTEGMLPFENMVADYVKETNNHVLYRVTPIFEEDCLVANGVQMEAMSVEDNGEGICFNVYIYNVQPGVEIHYSTGASNLATTDKTEDSSTQNVTYILNTNNRKFHKADCSSVKDIKDKNKQDYTGTREDLISQGYDPCGRCKP